MTLHDRVSAMPGGSRAIAASRLRRAVLTVLGKAFNTSGIESQAELAKRLKVRRSAVNQVFRGDGNVRINTLAEYLSEMGFEVSLTLVNAGELRAAVLEDRAPIPAFGSTGTSTTMLYSLQNQWTTQGHLWQNRAPSWGAAAVLDANATLQVLVLLTTYGELASTLALATPVFESIDLSRELLESGATQ
jgi:transcriptional regulator with XRE-family HTH domain